LFAPGIALAPATAQVVHYGVCVHWLAAFFPFGPRSTGMAGADRDSEAEPLGHHCVGGVERRRSGWWHFLLLQFNTIIFCLMALLTLTPTMTMTMTRQGKRHHVFAQQLVGFYGAHFNFLRLLFWIQIIAQADFPLSEQPVATDV
jgi:hypothetical protein